MVIWAYGNILLILWYGLGKGNSCPTNFLETFESFIKSVDVIQLPDLVYLAFQEAFNKVPHQRL